MAGQLDVSLVLKARDQGFTAEVTGSEAELERLASQARSASTAMGSIQQGTTRATNVLGRLRAVVSSTANSLRRGARQGFGQLGLQLQDIAVQAQAGVSPLTIFAQQGSQIASAFGPAGAVIGTVAAVTASLVAVLLNSSDGMAKTEAAAKSLKTALDAAKETIGENVTEAGKLTKAYAEASAEMQRLGLLDLERDMRAATGAIEDQAGAFRDLLEQLGSAAEARLGTGLFTEGRVGLGGLAGQLTRGEAETLSSTVAGLRSGDVSQVEAVERLQELAAGASAELQGVIDKMLDAAAATAELNQQMQELEEARESVSKMVEGTGQELGRLGGQLEGVQDKVGETTGSFKTMYDEVVGRSYVPDMVTQSEIWFDRLGNHMTSTTREATGGVADAFIGLDRQVSGTLARMITTNKLALEDFADFGLDIANQVLSGLIQVGISAGIGYFAGGAGAGAGAGFTGAGMSSGQATTSSGVLHAGGIVGAGGARRLVDPALFAGAERYHAGGMVFRPGEVPIIAKRGERVIPAGQAAAPQVVVNVVNETGAKVEHRQRRMPGGVQVHDIIVGEAARGMARGDFDQAMAVRFGLRPGRPA